MNHSSIIKKFMVAILLLPQLCLAQTNTENFAQLKFNFNNPGARATAMGGAFISIADDATASEANPAGLTTLIRPEFSFELKGIQYTRNIFNYSSTGTADNFSLAGHDFNNSVVSPSFVSFVYPKDRFTFSAFRYELVNFESSYFTKGAFVPGFTDGSNYFPVKSDLDMTVTNWGAAAGFKLNENISVGASFGVSKFNIDSKFSRYSLAVFDEGTFENGTTIDDNDTDVFFNIGLNLKISDNITLGAIYKRRPQFTVNQLLTQTNFPNDLTARDSINFNIPSAFGAGISYRPNDVFTVALDVVDVKYSDLTDNFVLTAARESFTPNDFKADDGVEVHVGAEYVTFYNQLGLVFRGGFYVEPDNRIKFAGNGNGDFTRETFKILFQDGDSTVHGTFGLGLLFTENFQLDLAGNLSDSSDEFVASFVYRL